jgi:hypothetical protein
MSIYDRPTKILMRDFASERLRQGQTFEKRDAVNWFAKNYPKIRPTTVQMHVEGMSVNNEVRKHHPNIKPGSDHDLFYKVRPGEFRLWDRAHDPAPIYKTSIEEAGENGTTEGDIVEGDDPTPSSEFAFEHDLRDYLARNLAAIEPGMKLYVDEEGEFNGVEYPVGGRFIDILAVDAKSDLVVIELKVSRGYDRTIGQLLRYMAWIKHNLAGQRRVRGLIVASNITSDLRLAASLLADVQLVEYELSLKLKPLQRA